MSFKMFRKNNKNKTFKQRGGFERELVRSLKDIDDQNDLACILRDNKILHNFAIDIFYLLLLKIRGCVNDEEKFKDLIRKNIIQKMDSKNVITDIGFNNNEIEEILETLKKKSNFLKLNCLKTKIHAITTSFTRLGNPAFQSLYIQNDPDLFEEFLIKLRKIFNLPKSFTKENFLEIYPKDETNAKKKSAFDMLIVKILHTSNNVLGPIQLNYGREIFTRVDRQRDYEKKSEEVSKCFDDIIVDGNNNIYGVKNFLDTSNTFVESIFNFYNKKLIGGLSGSAYYLFFLITKIIKYQYVNKSILSKILCIAVMDYVPLWHSLEEILITYSVEFKKYGFPEYTIDEDPIKYFKHVIEASNPSSTIRSMSV